MNSFSRVTINTANIRYNILQFRDQLSAQTKIAAVIKSNAYGHGMVPMADFLEKNKLVDYLAVANDMEALTLRRQKIKLPLIVLSYWDENNLSQLATGNIELAVYDLKQLRIISAFAAKNANIFVKIHIKIDTGMHRLGLEPVDIFNFLDLIAKHENILLQGLFSHLAVADERNKFTDIQIKEFYDIVAKIGKSVKLPLLHVANSAGSLHVPGGIPYMVRLGIAMYGLRPAADFKILKLKPVLSWTTKVLQVKKIAAGERLGYGLTYKFKKPSIIAVLAIGYADGYNRKLSNRGEVIIKQKKYPIRGRVCMNLTMVEVDGKVQSGDEAVLIGAGITADKLADQAQTISYEILAGINPEIQRIFQ